MIEPRRVFCIVAGLLHHLCNSNVKKHASEIDKMTDPEHLRLIPLVEAALALMRLSCEKFFVLVSVYLSYLLFRDPPGEAMRFMIRLNAR